MLGCGNFQQPPRNVKDIFALEVAAACHVVVSGEKRCIAFTQELFDLFQTPYEEFSFDTFRIGILRRIKPSCRVGHFAHDVIQDSFRDRSSRIVAAHLVIMKIETRQQSIVVQHLLEVRHEPARVGGITMKTATQLIVDAPLSHLLTCMADYFQSLLIAGAVKSMEQKLKSHGRGKLWRTPETTISCIVVLDDSPISSVQKFSRKQFA